MVTKECSNCHHLIPEDAKYCFNCGTQFQFTTTTKVEIPDKDITNKKKIIPRHSQEIKPINKGKPPKNIIFWVASIMLFLILASIFGLAIYWFNQENPKITEYLTVKAPEFPQLTSSKRISERELEQTNLIINKYYNPSEIGSNFILHNLGDPTQKRTYKNGDAYKIQGILSRIAPLEQEITEDLPQASLLEISGLGSDVSVFYRGNIGFFKLGDPIEVSGIYDKETNLINAFRVQRINKDPINALWEGLWLIRLAIFVVIWMIFCVTFLFWRSFRYSRYKEKIISPILTLILITFLTSACELNIKTSLNPDGSGAILTSLIDTKENMEFFRKVPGLKGYLESWKKSLRGSGLLVDHIDYGQTEEILFQKSFGSLEELSKVSKDSGQASWVFAEKYADGDVMVYRFFATIDTAGFFEKIPGMDSNVQSMMNKEMNQLTLRYDVEMPGMVVYHNGQELIGNQVTWQLKMNEINHILVESNLPLENIQSDGQNDYLLILIMLVCIFLFSNTLLIISFSKYHIHRTKVE